MVDGTTFAILISLCVIFVVCVFLTAREELLRRRKKEEEEMQAEKGCVAIFLLDIYPNSANVLQIADHVNFELFKVQRALRALEEENLVRDNGKGVFTYIVYGGERRLYPPLRLVKK